MALGVENLKVVLVSLVHVGNKIDEVTQDGYQVVQDTVALLPSLVDLVGIIKKGKEAYGEFLDLDDVEKEEVTSALKEEFDLLDEELEDILEKAFVFVEDGALLLLAINKAKKK